MMTLITGFTCPPTTLISSLLQSATSVITKCDGLLLQSVTILLQSATVITKCDSTNRSSRILFWGFSFSVPCDTKGRGDFLGMIGSQM